jgi:hypothetical protein
MGRKFLVGADIFKKLRESGAYFVDKSKFISEVVRHHGRVELITRPRRFGKSVNLSMLESFFKIGADPALFDGLEIAEDKEVWDEYFGKYPVLRISLKDIAGSSFETFLDGFKSKLEAICPELMFLLDSEKI